MHAHPAPASLSRSAAVTVCSGLLVVGLVAYLALGPSGADTWSGADPTLVGAGTNVGCAAAAGASVSTSEGFSTQGLATSQGGESQCGPCMVQDAGVDSVVHCNRDYTFGPGYASFFTEYAGRHLTLVQDAHGSRHPPFAA